MKIRRMFATFAGLEESRLELGPGLNIIEGENESGKSTWCAFLRAMLFGIPTRERDTKERRAEKNLYRPWSGSPISGRIELESDGLEISVERSGSDAAPLRTFRAVTSGGGDAGLTADNFGERMTGASREVFERSAFVSSPPLPSGSAELEARILSTVSSGDEGEGAAAAEERLRRWQRRLKYNRSGEISELTAEIERLRREAEDCRAVANRIASAEDELREATAREKVLERCLKRMGSAERAAAERELSAAQARLDAASAERSGIERDVLPEGCPSTAELRSLESRVAAERAASSARTESIDAELAAVEKRIFGCVNRAQRAYGALPSAPTFAGRAVAAAQTNYQAGVLAEEISGDRTPGLLRAFALILAAAALGCLIPLPFIGLNAFLLAAAGVSLILCGVLAALSAKRGKRKKLAAESLEKLYRDWKIGSLDELRAFIEEAKDADARYAELVRRKSGTAEGPSPAEDELAALTGERGGPLDTLRTLIEWSEKRDALLRREADERERISMLKNAVLAKKDGGDTDAADGDEDPDLSRRTRGEVEEELELLRRRTAGLRRDSALAEGSLAGRDPALLDEERGRLEDRLRECERRYRAITLALEALSRANEEMRSRFSPALSAETARILGELTGGRYDRVSVSREFRPEAGGESSTLLHPVSELSRGTSDQLWLALRLAVVRTVLPPSVPIVLDDALVSFDDRRLEAALRLLEHEAETRQILLFTCHGREAKMCAGHENVNIIRL